MADRGILGERRLRLAEMDTPVRRIIFATYAVLAAQAIGVIIREYIAGPILPAFIGTVFPRNILLIGVAASCMAVVMIVAGAAHARTGWRYLLIAPVLAAIGICIVLEPSRFVDSAEASRYHGLMWLPAPFLLATISLVWLAPRLKTAKILLFSFALASTFVAAITTATLTMHAAYGPTVFAVMMYCAAAAVAPAVMVTGFDLAELGSEFILFGLRPVFVSPRAAAIARWSLPVLAMAAATYILYLSSFFRDSVLVNRTVVWGGLILLAAIIAFVVMRRRPVLEQSAHTELGYLPFLVIAIVIFSGVISVFFRETEPNRSAFGMARGFSLHVPEGMHVRNYQFRTSMYDSRWTTASFYTGPGHGRLPALYIVGVPQPTASIHPRQPRNVNELIDIPTGFSEIPLVLDGTAGSTGWRKGHANVTTLSGRSIQFFMFKYENVANGTVEATDWYLVCSDKQVQAKTIDDICSRATQSFRFGVAAALERSSRPAARMFSGLFLAAAAGSFLWATRRARRGQDSATLDFAAWAFLLTAVRWTSGYLFGGVDDPFESLQADANLLAAMVGAVAIAAAGVSLWGGAAARRTTGQAAGIAIALAAIVLAYAFVIKGGHHSQTIRGFIIMAALSWEMWTAGTFLNPKSEHHVFRRASRVLIFAGYLILVASCVFTFSEMKMTTGATLGAFDTEMLVVGGLATLGGALLISRSLLELANLSRRPVSEPG
jgi:hypothetical protein